MSNAIGSCRESNPSRGTCNVRAVLLGHLVDQFLVGLYSVSRVVAESNKPLANSEVVIIFYNI